MKLFTKLISLTFITIFLSGVFAQAPEFTWAQNFGGSLDDYVYGMTIDDEANIYVIGKFKSTPLDFGNGVSISAIALFDIYLVKYDPTGLPLWAVQAGGQVTNEARDVAVNFEGDVAITGGYFGQADFSGTIINAVNNFDTYIANYSSAGALEWIVTGNGEKQIKGTGLVTDNDGNYIACGYFGGSTTDTMNFAGTTVTGNGNRDIYIAKITPAGNVLWITSAGGPESGDEPSDIAIDGDNNIYVTGYFKDTANFGSLSLTSEGGNDMFTAKLDPNGNFLWVQGGHGPGNNRGVASDFDRVNGNLLITGYMEDTLTVDTQEFISNGNDDIVVISYSSNGDVNFAGIMGDTEDDHGLGVKAIGDGNYYLAGYSENPFGGMTAFGNDDFVLMEMNGLTPVWMESGGGSDIDQWYGIELDAANNILMGGSMKSGSGSLPPFTLTSTGGRDIVIAKVYDNVVPVELVSFTAAYSSGIVDLNWETATETNNLGFEVLKSMDLKSFNKIGFVDGAGSTSEKQTYTFVDSDIQSPVCYYKLKQIDLNGEFTYSNTVEVSIGIPTEYSLDQNYPNPFNPSTKINFALPVDGNVKLNVHNLLGEEVADLLNRDMTAGTHTAQFNASGLTTGIYIYTINVIGNDGSSFTSSHKMILMK